MALARRCLGCKQRTTAGSYCKRCWHAKRKIRTGWDWGTIRAEVHARDHACVRCGSTERLQVHHRIAVVDGGSNTLDNLELLCAGCHERGATRSM
jgi:5-methylcytosine-specific restriction endonuclease McrA